MARKASDNPKGRVSIGVSAEARKSLAFFRKRYGIPGAEMIERTLAFLRNSGEPVQLFVVGNTPHEHDIVILEKILEDLKHKDALRKTLIIREEDPQPEAAASAPAPVSHTQPPPPQAGQGSHHGRP